MKSSFTQDYLIQFIYNELPQEEALVLAKALQEDSVLREEYSNLNEAVLALDLFKKPEPSEASIGIILDYAKKKEEEEHLAF